MNAITQNRLALCGAAAIAAMALCGCRKAPTAAVAEPKSPIPAVDFTRGVGLYPGDPNENFSPDLAPDYSTYRNIALRRAAYASSSFDYNLTAQLATDGIVTDKQPQRLTLLAHKDTVPRREREWMIDEGPYSCNTIYGDSSSFQFSLGNYAKKADKLALAGTVVYNRATANEGYEIVCLASNDGLRWTELGRAGGNGLPGEEVRNTQETDPNKQAEQSPIASRRLNETVNLNAAEPYSAFRVHFKMKGAYKWDFTAADFSDGGELVDLKPSQFFNSAWMSATAGEEWLYVDLGVGSELKKVVLRWINKAVKGKVQVSNDAKRWSDAAYLPGGESLTDELKMNEEARYVRVLMQQPAGGKPYILSEMEVYGRGGMIVKPAAAAAPAGNKLPLSGGGWTLQRASEVDAGGEQISTPGFKAGNWIAATVPGTVLTSYRNIGAIPDPNYADNQVHISESFFNSNFWYRNAFDIPAGFKKKRLFLDFDGINWKANVFLNGTKLGCIEGAFMRGRFDVTGIAAEGRNVLAVEIVKNEHIGSVKQKNELSTDFNGGILGADNPTFHATIGWDWIPTIRGRNIGIWNDVYLTTSGDVTVADPLVKAALPLPKTSPAKLTAEVFVKNHASEPVKGTLEGLICDTLVEREIELAAGEERLVAFGPEEFPQLNKQNPRLWWPNGYGYPYLYNSSFAFRIDSQISDSIGFKVGIRQMDFDEKNGALNLYVNGRRFIGRGGNWGFSESNLNYRRREYDAAVAYHQDMNFTMIRNWVGMTGDEEFYDACDRHGIMVWQDFWLANPADGPDPYCPDMFIANADDYVRRIRSHPSIGIYCGRNEGFPPERIDTALRRIVAEKHPGIHYISSSADGAVSGHGPYKMLPAKQYFTLKAGNDKFHTERGMPNVMTYESMARTFSPKGIWPQGDEWGMHDYTRRGAQGCSSFNQIIAKGYGKPKDPKRFAELAQFVNYDGHRSLFESRSKNRQGLLMWMSHPCWPSMVWQTYDYFFEPTAAYFAIKKANEPLHIQWNPATDDVEVVNYSAGLRTELTATAQVLNMEDASVVWEKEATFDSHDDSTAKLFKLQFPEEKLSEVHFIKLTLTEKTEDDGVYYGENEKGKILSDNFYLRSFRENNYKEILELPTVKLSAVLHVQAFDGQSVWRSVITIKNLTSTPALMIRLNVVGDKDRKQILPVIYDDNYFSMLPGEEKLLVISWREEDTRGQTPRIFLSGFNVEEKPVLFIDEHLNEPF